MNENPTHFAVPAAIFGAGHYGLSGKLVKAACRCVGNAVAPQVVQPFARAIRKMIIQEKNLLPNPQ